MFSRPVSSPLKPVPTSSSEPDAAVQVDLAGGGLGDAAEDFEQRAFARAVAADDADDVAPLDVEADVLERPKGFGVGSGPAERLAEPAGGGLGERGRPVAVVPDRVGLGQAPHADHDFAVIAAVGVDGAGVR